MAQNDYKINLGVKVDKSSKKDLTKEINTLKKSLEKENKVNFKLNIKVDDLKNQINEFKTQIKALKQESKDSMKSLKSDIKSVSKEYESRVKLVEKENNKLLKQLEKMKQQSSLKNIGNRYGRGFESLDKLYSSLSNTGLDINKFAFLKSSGGITKYRDELGRVLTITEKLNKEGASTFGYNLAYNFDKLTNSVEKTYAQTNNLISGIKGLRETTLTMKAADLKKQIDKTYDSLYQTQKEMSEAYREDNFVRVENLTSRYKEQKNTLDSLKTSLTEVTNSIKRQGDSALKLGDLFKKVFSNITSYTIVIEAFRLGKKAIADMVKEVKNLDDSLTEFKKVSDLSGDSLDRYVKKAYEAGETVAKTG